MSLTLNVVAGRSQIFALGFKDRAGVATVLAPGGPLHELFVQGFKSGNEDQIVGGMAPAQGFSMPYDAGKPLTVRILNKGTVARDVTVHTTS